MVNILPGLFAARVDQASVVDPRHLPGDGRLNADAAGVEVELASIFNAPVPLMLSPKVRLLSSATFEPLFRLMVSQLTKRARLPSVVESNVSVSLPEPAVSQGDASQAGVSLINEYGAVVAVTHIQFAQ